MTGGCDPKYPAPGGINPIDEKEYKNGSKTKWDATQRVRSEIINPGVAHGDLPAPLLPNGAVNTQSHFWDLEPSKPIPSDVMPQSFPTLQIDPLGGIGNDDTNTADEDDDPYHTVTNSDYSILSHAQGSVREMDLPQTGILSRSVATARDVSRNYADDGANFIVFESFGAFLRVQLGQKWYRVSSYQNWFYRLNAVYQSGQWIDNGSGCGVSTPSN